MRAPTLCIVLLIVFSGCVSKKTKLDTWIGSSKHQLILSWGPPVRTENDGNGGEVLVYAHEVYIPEYRQHYWDYKMMYADKDGKIYHWRMSRQQIPPTQIVITGVY